MFLHRFEVRGSLFGVRVVALFEHMSSLRWRTAKDVFLQITPLRRWEAPLSTSFCSSPSDGEECKNPLLSRQICSTGSVASVESLKETRSAINSCGAVLGVTEFALGGPLYSSNLIGEAQLKCSRFLPPPPAISEQMGRHLVAEGNGRAGADS